MPLIFYKRLSDVFDDECQQYIEHFGDEELARQFIEEDHRYALAEGCTPMVRFYIPDEYRWIRLRNHPTDEKLGEFVTDAMGRVAALNPTLRGVIDVRDYNERQSGQRTLDDDRLSALIEIISRHRLGIRNAEPDILGRAYEYLLRKFAEGQGQSAGEFYTPKEVGWLIAELINPRLRSTIYDPACGSGGLLIKARLLFEERNPEDRGKAPLLFGQQALEDYEKLAEQYIQAHEERRQLGLDPNAFAIYTQLKQTVPAISAQQAAVINEAFERYPDYQWNEQQKVKLTADIYKLLYSVCGVVKSSVDITQKLLELERI